MLTDVVVINPENTIHRSQLQQLFDQYHTPEQIEFDPGLVDRLMALPYFTGFLAFINQQPAGFAICFESFSTYRCKPMLNIHDFMVTEEFQGQGIGKELMTKISDWASRQGMLKITLEVNQENEAAQAVYRALGFEPTEVRLPGLLHWQKYLQ